MSKTRSDETWAQMTVALVIVGLLGFMVIQPYFEAQAFNKLTGGNATYADAFWAELRIDGSSQIIKGNQ